MQEQPRAEDTGTADKTAKGDKGDTKGHEQVISEDVRLLHSMGYAQELLRRMNGFSNFAVSFSIICILAGGLTSYHIGLSAAGGASIGLGWPLSCLISLCFALAMAQLASALGAASQGQQLGGGMDQHKVRELPDLL